ncbi:MAG: NUDIX hydrolase [Oscillatoriales cyanobacterium C42_A2020_001]|nr:NUDIX hydrolase [Leptolyngbyaceae cyanobacterium C42_A2020_001]
MILQSGVIPYRFTDTAIEVLLVSSSSGKRWVIPKGWIDLGLSSEESAAKEAWEEAGVRGMMITPAIGHYHTRKWGLIYQVEVFLMRVEQEEAIYPEVNVRTRTWVTIETAIALVRKAELKRLLNQIRPDSLHLVEQQ